MVLSVGRLKFYRLFIHYYSVWRLTELLKAEAPFLHQISYLTLAAHAPKVSRDGERLCTKVPYLLFEHGYLALHTFRIEPVGNEDYCQQHYQYRVSYILEDYAVRDDCSAYQPLEEDAPAFAIAFTFALSGRRFRLLLYPGFPLQW